METWVAVYQQHIECRVAPIVLRLEALQLQLGEAVIGRCPLSLEMSGREDSCEGIGISLYISPCVHTVSNAFSISVAQAMVGIRWFNLVLMSDLSVTRACVVERPALNPNGSSGSVLFRSQWVSISSLKAFS